MSRPLWQWSLLALGYLAVALVVSWPLALHLGDGLLGTATMDQVDTAWLRLASARWLTGQDPGIFAPLGYPLPAVVPNWVDHLLGAPLALALPWPLADNLFWLGLIVANGLAGHALGRHVGGSHAAGLLCGLGFAISEPVLREINASHAPQALLLWAPLFLLFLLRGTGSEGRARDGVLAGIFLGLAALSYWYQGLFLAVLAAPVVLHGLWVARREERLGAVVLSLGVATGAALLLCGPFLAASLAAAPELAGVSEQVLQHVPGMRGQPVPPEHAWTFLHGSGPSWLWRAEPLATASRLSPVLLLAAVVGAWRGPGPRWPWVLAAALGGLLLMGPFLQVGGEPITVGGRLVPLPGWLLAELSDAAGRLHWPARWAVIVPLALLPLAARVPRPAIWAAVLLVATLLLSGNAPLQVSPVGAFAGWRVLEASPGPVLVLPQEPEGDGASTMGFIFRASGAPLANELGVPPRAAQPIAFRRWHEDLGLRGWWRHVAARGEALEPPPEALAQLREEGIAAVALDVTPGCALEPTRNEAIARMLESGLGEPVDYGPVMVWWLDPPAVIPEPMHDASEWRAREHAALVAAGARRGKR
jgi:hypothetical protein